MTFYRYELINYESGPKLLIRELYLRKETPKGYWIGEKYSSTRRWVSKTSRKRYAYPTKEAAFVNYIKRTERRELILKHQIQGCEAGLIIAKKLQDENNI